jgi:hypothetical protein
VNSSYQTFAVRVGIWRSVRNSKRSDAGAFDGSVELVPELRITVSDEKSWSRRPRCGVAQLLRGPFAGWVSVHGEMDEGSALQLDDHERKDRSKENVVGLNESARPDVARVVS